MVSIDYYQLWNVVKNIWYEYNCTGSVVCGLYTLYIFNVSILNEKIKKCEDFYRWVLIYSIFFILFLFFGGDVYKCLGGNSWSKFLYSISLGQKSITDCNFKRLFFELNWIKKKKTPKNKVKILKIVLIGYPSHRMYYLLKKFVAIVTNIS